jgi:nucleoside-diphosphate-sugar epimerase
MVIGNGLIAKAFKEYQNNDSIVIFASGVSDSLQTNRDEFAREKKLLLEHLIPGKKLIYFSTCSILDESLQQESYVFHKKEIENIIKEQQESYIIFRLPIIVGESPNPHTLTNFLYNHIAGNEIFQVYANSCRYLLDIDDAVKIISMIIERDYCHNEIVNVVLNNRISVPDLVKLFEKALETTARQELVDKGSCYTVENGRILMVLDELKIHVDNDYNFRLIKKYYGLQTQNQLAGINSSFFPSKKSV